MMSDAILVCRGKTPITSAARTMTQAGWSSVLVVDAKGKVLGVVSGRTCCTSSKTAWMKTWSSAM